MRIKKPLCIGDELLVQVTKEALKTKTLTVSSKLSFKGKYALLTVGDTRVGISNKIEKTIYIVLKSRCDLRYAIYKFKTKLKI